MRIESGSMREPARVAHHGLRECVEKGEREGEKGW